MSAKQIKKLELARSLWEKNHCLVVDVAQRWLKEWFPEKDLKIEETRLTRAKRDEDWASFEKHKEELLRLLRSPELETQFRRFAAKHDLPESIAEIKPWSFGEPLAGTNGFCRLLGEYEREVGRRKLSSAEARRRIIVPIKKTARLWRRFFDSALCQAKQDTGNLPVNPAGKDRPLRQGIGQSRRLRIRRQRIRFCEPLRKKEKTWPEIYDAYHKKYPDDKDASPDTLRLSFTRNPPKSTDSSDS